MAALLLLVNSSPHVIEVSPDMPPVMGIAGQAHRHKIRLRRWSLRAHVLSTLTATRSAGAACSVT